MWRIFLFFQGKAVTSKVRPDFKKCVFVYFNRFGLCILFLKNKSIFPEYVPA